MDSRRIELLGWSPRGAAVLVAWARESREQGGAPFAAYPCCEAYSGEQAGTAGSPGATPARD